MLEYIYFVKCPGCEDEHFDFFNDAKDFAMSCLSQKPIITQIEVDRNDFGECVDSCDLGTIWSWEEMMNTEDEPVNSISKSIFTRDDFKQFDPDNDPEFTNLDDTLDTVPDNFRKPIPADMSIEDLVEELEENEDTVECTKCGELFDKASCHHNKEGLGWCCSKCESVDALAEASDRPLYIIKDRNGNQLSAPNTDDSELWDRVESLDPNGRRGLMVVAYTGSRVDESFNPIKEVEFNYDDLDVTLQGPKRDVDDWDEKEDIVNHSIYKKQRDVATNIWENFIEEKDVVPHTLEDLNDDRLWDDFLATHFDELLDKYYDQLLDYYRDEARNDYEANNVLESVKPKQFLEELEEPEDYRKHLVDCPECGVNESFDPATGICINCGFNI